MPAAKTSLTHPLRIDSVSIADGGSSGLTFCPGKKHHGLHAGAWHRDLDRDLEAARNFGAAALVTLMEREELAAVEVPMEELAGRTAALGLEWHHLPIRDADIPGEIFEDLWTYSGFRLRTLLSGGGKIVIHCLGGLGRTGTVAARLLVEFGDSPENAMAKVRQARPGSIENSVQEDYVLDCKPFALARGRLSSEERALACLIGGAIGDAFGYEVEFKKLYEIRQRFGPSGITAPVLRHGLLPVSDDTQMTLFTLEGLLRALRGPTPSKDSFVPSIREAYLDWLSTQDGAALSGQRKTYGWLASQPEMRALRAPGLTCVSALRAGGIGAIDQPVNDSKGCGGVMRAAPIGLIGDIGNDEAVFQLAAESAALTHGHPSGYLSAGLAACLVRLLMTGARLEGALEQSLDILRNYERHEETLDAVQLAVDLVEAGCTDHDAAIEALGEGWVGEEALAIGLYSVLSADTFPEALAIAANHNGDSDSTAAIAGQFWGAVHGLDGMPHAWISALDVRLPLFHLARQMMPSCAG